MKYFLSQPMNGKTDAEILAERKSTITAIGALHPDAELVDSFINENLSEKHDGLRYLARSLDLLDSADVIYMLPGWEDARGCRIERNAALSYGIDVKYL